MMIRGSTGWKRASRATIETSTMGGVARQLQQTAGDQVDRLRPQALGVAQAVAELGVSKWARSRALACASTCTLRRCPTTSARRCWMMEEACPSRSCPAPRANWSPTSAPRWRSPPDRPRR